MPVVNVHISKLSKCIPNVGVDTIIEKLPYLGLDIEDIDQKNDLVKIEFNPNRPDYATENGIIRALLGLFGIEVGTPSIKKLVKSDKDKYIVRVNKNLENIRPIIRGLVAKRKNPLLNDEIASLISMQEDLHNGLGRKRKKSSIGIHNLDKIDFPVIYSAFDGNFSFIPLDNSSHYTLSQILNDFKSGKEYRQILEGHSIFPIILDSSDNVLSFPPIINGNLTRVDSETQNLFIEITSINAKSAEDVLSIMSYELNDLGFDIYEITIESNIEGKIYSPRLDNRIISVETDYVNRILGLTMTSEYIVECLKKSRCDGNIQNESINCIVPSYRTDLINSIDVCEEIAIGFGIYKLEPLYSEVYVSGNKNRLSQILDYLRDVLVGLGFIEIINSNIISKKSHLDLFQNFDNDQNSCLFLNDSKSEEYEILRTSTMPTLLKTLSINIHEKYPQRLFEIGKTFLAKDSQITEKWSLGAVIAHNTTNYSEIKSVVESLMKYCFDYKISTHRFERNYFLPGHAAEIVFDGNKIGEIGQVHPHVLESLNMRTLVTIFELDLSSLIQSNMKTNNF